MSSLGASVCLLHPPAHATSTSPLSLFIALNTTHDQLARIMIDCWNPDPKKRPSFAELRTSIAVANVTVDATKPTSYEDLQTKYGGAAIGFSAHGDSQPDSEATGPSEPVSALISRSLQSFDIMWWIY